MERTGDVQGWRQGPALFPPLTCCTAGLEAPACCQNPTHLLPALTLGEEWAGAGALASIPVRSRPSEVLAEGVGDTAGGGT